MQFPCLTLASIRIANSLLQLAVQFFLSWLCIKKHIL